MDSGKTAAKDGKQRRFTTEEEAIVPQQYFRYKIFTSVLTRFLSENEDVASYYYTTNNRRSSTNNNKPAELSPQQMLQVV